MDDLRPLSYFAVIEEVLIPETATLLIMEDMSITERGDTVVIVYNLVATSSCIVHKLLRATVKSCVHKPLQLQ
jgi:hypothetical protein